MILKKRVVSGSSALLASMFLATLLLGACSEGNDNNNASAPLTVPTAKGKVAGIKKGGMREFLGIPYAAPPVGKLRWKPPQPAQAWSTTLSAKHFANHCPQSKTVFGLKSMSEDCLYLNVFAPTDDKTHPVMVWIHGGALAVGESDDYDPSQLVKEGVIVVTMNYRLGILGFLAHPALSAESSRHASGDYGLMDQEAALKWVQTNISNFGGDPDNVTIFGESAGARSVLYLMASPSTRNLFDKAISESGSGFNSLSQPTLGEKEAQGEKFATKLGCTQQTAACLRQLSVADILGAQGVSALPNLRPDFLPHTVGKALRTGNFHHVPVLLGTNRNEWRIFVGLSELSTGPIPPELYVPAIKATLAVSAADAKTVAQQYPLSDYENISLALGALGTDGIFACKDRTLARRLSTQGVRTYIYEFNDPNAPILFLDPSQFDFPFASSHTTEIQYLFDFFDPDKLLKQPSNLTAKQKELSRKMVDYWTQFAKTGNPNPPSGAITNWPAFDSASHTYLSLTPPSPKQITDFAQEHMCGFWEQSGLEPIHK